MKIGVFGGTFNPFHNGHKRLLLEADSAVGFDKLFVIPDRLPPHKTAENLASDTDRFNICRLAVSDIKKAEVSDIELKSRDEKSYSVLTLRKLKRLYPDDKLYFIMGSDMLLCFESWCLYREIQSLCTLVCMARLKTDAEKLLPAADKLRRNGEVILVDSKPLEVSSTEIRRLISENKDLTCLLDKKVVEYILRNGVYR